MTENEIKAANLIIERAPDGWVNLDYFAKLMPAKMETYSDLGKAIDSLVENNILDRDSKKEGEWSIKITNFGKELRGKQKGYGEFLKEKAEKEVKEAEKEKRDEEYKNLQVQDLVAKLNTINPNQLDFWRSQKERNKQATFIAIISAIFSLIAMFKSFGYL